MKILFIDACARRESRTKMLADALIKKLNGETEHLALYEIKLPDLTKNGINARNEDCKNLNFSDSKYDYAKQFADADIIVIAAPFWDLSFPAVLKKYIETISVTGLTFSYSDTGIPIGLCKAKKLYYVTTAGGTIFNEEYGFGYIKALATSMYGIKKCVMFKAEGLDIYGSNVDEIMQSAINNIKI